MFRKTKPYQTIYHFVFKHIFVYLLFFVAKIQLTNQDEKVLIEAITLNKR